MPRELRWEAQGKRNEAKGGLEITKEAKRDQSRNTKMVVAHDRMKATCFAKRRTHILAMLLIGLHVGCQVFYARVGEDLQWRNEAFLPAPVAYR